MSKIPLNEFITLQRGFDLPSNKRISGSVPVVASTGIAGYHNEIKVKAPGVVIGRSGSIGGGQYIEKDFFPLNTTLYVKDFKGHYPRFIYYLLKSIDFTSFNVGTGVPTLNRNHLSSILISALGIDKEKEIANILGSLDQKIQLNIQINQTLEQIAQALFKSWFVDFDPVRAKVQALSDGLSLEQSELAAMQAISGKTPEELTALSQTQPDRYVELAETAKAFPCEMVKVDGVEVPKGWELKPFGSLLENTIGGDWGKEEEDEKHTENVFVFRGTDLPNVQINEFDVIPKRYIAKNKLKSRKAKYGDIIIEVSGGSKNQPTGRSLLITKNLLCNFNLPIIPASFCRLFTPINEKIAVLLACHLKMIYTQGKTWEYQVQSTGISNFQTKNFLENELVVIPDENIFNAFYEKVGVIFEKMTSNENMLLSKTRDLLLPRLLNGKI
ncbi:restriction endonuclease subunit S [Haemophilus influenzae]|uniref:Type I restriction modification DNA specificity domain protein n=1 Tax=Haemophilus influenzae TaxID=727 RepID=A0AB37B3Y8_HAEIF|nr:restriction endonuclease subunit S [Haemophilus influenzae]PRJ22671.1 Type I restriction modification DNA specificity domain protein [Haemophilus influenzae]PRM81459.1 Type I restriction modification DNA specificity domain protein [Haemophilus influenzae]